MLQRIQPAVQRAAVLAMVGIVAACSSSAPDKASLPRGGPLYAQTLQWISAEREKVKVPALAPHSALDTAAQRSADEIAHGASLEQAGDTGEMAARVHEAGYPQERLIELFLTGDGAPAKVLSDWRRANQRGLAALTDATYRDLGIGLAWRGGTLICVLVLGVSEADGFARRTASLADPDKVRAETVQMVNAERARRQLAPLKDDAVLDGIAQRQAQVILEHESWTESDVSRALAEAVRKSGYRDSDIGFAYSEGSTSVADAMGTRFARANDRDPLLSASVRDIGVGMARGVTPQGPRTVWVQIVGRKTQDELAELQAGLGDLAAIREEMLARVNAERESLGLPPLRENSLLDQAAQSHADDMIRRSYFGHESPEGASALNRASKARYPAAAIGENVAQGQHAVAEVMVWWMASSGHREQIVSPVYKEIGIGVAFGQAGAGLHVVWVQVFGSPRASKRPKT